MTTCQSRKNKKVLPHVSEGKPLPDPTSRASIKMEPGQTQGHTQHPPYSLLRNKNQDNLVNGKRMFCLKILAL